MRGSVAIILVSALTLGALPASAQGPQDPTPIVQVGVFKTRQDGTQSSAAYTTSEDPSFKGLQSLIYTGHCFVGAGYAQPRKDATHAWRVSGQIISATADEAVVQLEWQRMLTDGQPSTSPAGSAQLTLRVGERTILDPLPSLAGDQCGEPPITAVNFEARYAPRSFGFGFVGRGGGGGAGRPSGVAGAAGGSRGFGGAGAGAGGGGALVGRRAATESAYDAELWLVHSAPGRADVVQPQRMRVISNADFSFAPTTVAVPDGTLTVRVFGSLHVVTTAAGQGNFLFVADRQVTFAPLNRPARDPAPQDRSGRASAAGPLPGPDSVLEFVMPPLEMPGGASLGDRIAVRLRLRPAP